MPIKVIELFAGVGGFRIGLEGYPKEKKSPYEVIWSNQWEPSTKTQHANRVYKKRWPHANHSEENIEEVIEHNFDEIPDHDLLVGGFPCQDYSVATTLNNSKGLIGKKGVLWWSIEAILRKKRYRPKYLLLENVDRLLKSPSTQRGRDFAVMLSSLNNLGYAVEWRVINAADYGMPQRRRRIFFIAYHRNTPMYQKLKKSTSKSDWLDSYGTFAKAFPIETLNGTITMGTFEKDLVKVSDTFNLNQKFSPFKNCGLMVEGQFWTAKPYPAYKGEFQVLGDILVAPEAVPEAFFISQEDVDRKKGWKYLKGAKNESRYNKKFGFHYRYSEGRMVFPDALDKASRTIITGEGGKSPSRFKHVVKQNGRLRRLTPVELEKLNMFPENHTEHEAITDAKRAFFMGNALVVGIIKQLGKELYSQIDSPKKALVD
ncbi:DNA (cytosine-5-)-methyltransferase [Pricia sp. S334]|uniref:Cytosine-specific methyltransferase n=1 Tax=Pricia mediterranea TaxID=3076079 RepID=A0ABU3L6C9_9FLAO|nr:DNA (cytosine-5-)-methyltransferase [Pricia sp. S334]MDT7828886.1 DNA (cytosine-5-)-methyltransferase [Pricia sp. S334]